MQLGFHRASNAKCFPDEGATLVPTLWPEGDIPETSSRRRDSKQTDAETKEINCGQIWHPTRL